MVKYVLNFTVDSRMGDACAASRGGAEPFDGVMEGWWESDDAGMAAMGSDNGRKAMELLHHDEETFMDFGRCVIFTVQEKVWQ